MKGIVHSYESLAAVDGEGLRYAVFLSGCPLRCVYCHNPDTWEMGRGSEIDPETLAKKLSRYKPYFGERGGVTFSGGEPLLQAEFLREMMPLLWEREIGYVIDTSGSVELGESVQAVLGGAQSVLLDLKFWDEESYRRYTGRGIASVLETLSYLNAIGKPTRIRTVIVPGINDREAVLDRYLAHVRDISCVTQFELLGFHTMGAFKYEKLGIPNPLAETKALTPDVKARLQAYVNQQMRK